MTETIYVPIVRSSIRHNPNAGDTMHHVSGSMTMEISGIIKNADMKKRLLDGGVLIDTKHLNVRATSWTTSFSKEGSHFGFNAIVWSDMTSDRTIRLLQQYFGREMRYSINYDNQIIQTLTPEPPYLYSYRVAKFDCPHCGYKGLTAKTMLSVTRYDGDGDECGNDLVCPSCEQEIEFHYERLVDTDLAEIADKNALAKKKRR